MLSATTLKKVKTEELVYFAPFMLHVIIGSLIASTQWAIPSSINPLYGELRIYIQLFNFIVLVLSTRGLTGALAINKAPQLLWKTVTLGVIIHGLASLWQLIAWATNLPLIGISRAHGQTMIEGVADVAVMATPIGGELIRPGGLAGEPKTVAVIYGIYLLVQLFINSEHNFLLNKRWVQLGATGLAWIGFITAFSTSAFVSFGVSYIILTVLFNREAIRSISILALTGFLLIGGWSYIGREHESTGLVELLTYRTLDRLENEGMDPPVDACLNELKSNIPVLIFGTGIGGSSFVIMKHLDQAVEYSYSPNILILSFATEHGLLGIIFLLAPFILIIYKINLASKVKLSMLPWECRLFICISVSSLIMNLLSSGIPLGFVLSVASISACLHIFHRDVKPINQRLRSADFCEVAANQVTV